MFRPPARAELLIDRIMRVCKVMQHWFQVADASDNDAASKQDSGAAASAIPHAGNFHVREVEHAVSVILGRIGLLYPTMQIVLPIKVAAFAAALGEICAFLQRVERALGMSAAGVHSGYACARTLTCSWGLCVNV